MLYLNDTYFVVILTIIAFGASLLTFYSGFGLGTLLLPTLMSVLPPSNAVFLTAIIHLSNNALKLIMMGKYADIKILKRFGIPSLIAALLGAFLLSELQPEKPWILYNIKNQVLAITPLKLLLGVIIFIFGIWELTPRLRELQIPEKYMQVGGFLSGFFGGLSGHQGALRSAFLIKTGLDKNTFIGTSVVIACGVDLARIGVYANKTSGDAFIFNSPYFWAAFLGATLGTFLGKRFLSVTPLHWIRSLTGGALMGFGLSLAMGLFGK